MSPPPQRLRQLLLLLSLAAAVLVLFLAGSPYPPGSTAGEKEPADSILFCFWNAENLFDDRDDKRTGPGDKEYDQWFADDVKARQLKFDRLSKALIEMNGGRGPDILALAEVESPRAAELLREALNKRLKDPALHYKFVLMRDPGGLRNIATAILTRLPVDTSRTQLLGRRQRILEGHIKVNGKELVIIASHWTSRVSDERGEGRERYADAIYNRYKMLAKYKPEVDFLVCGDFNDEPKDDSVTKHLHAVSLQDYDPKQKEPALIALCAGKDPGQFGTHSYRGRMYLFDQVVVSPGLLDTAGWSCEPKSLHVVKLTDPLDKKQQRPWRFGNENDRSERGYSDHFPVTVRLKVQEK